MNLFDLFVKIGVDDSDYNKKLDDASDKTKSFSNKVKTSLSVVTRAAAAGIGAAATAVGALAKSSMDAYADYEQLVGGVDTLFKDSSDKVQEYAANAYKTAGLSANDYMETVTGFSASLLQSLGDDTEAAADYADMAITDMSDNANKMGTDMELIQNAYQGFAKQNYTMLDNLKLGYGGTKDEMQRLIDDANKVKEANGEMADLSIDSFADVVEAIHTMQDEMGISGTTADEAATTIEGSVSSMKASWENLLTGIADDNADLDSLIDQFVDSVGTAADNIVPRFTQILEGLGELIEGLAPIIAEQLPVLIETVLPSLLEAGGSLLTGVINGIIEALPSLVDPAIELVNQLSTFIFENLPFLADTALQIIMTLAQGMSESLPELAGTVATAIIGIGEAIIENLPALLDAAVEIAQNIMDAVWEVLDTIGDELGERIPALGVIFDNLAVIVTGLVAAFVAFKGALAISTLIETVQGALSTMKSTTSLTTIAQKALNAAMNANPFVLIATLIAGVVTALLTLWHTNEDFRDAVKKAWNAIKDALNTVVDAIASFFTETIPNAINTAVSFIESLPQKALDAGQALIEGIWDGISGAAGWLWEKVSGWASDLWDGILDFFGIHSPSKQMAWVGEMLTQGLAGGITDNAEEAIKAAEDMARGIADVDYSMSTGGFSAGGGYGIASTQAALAGATINISVNGANIQNDQQLAERIAYELQNLTNRRAAAIA